MIKESVDDTKFNMWVKKKENFRTSGNYRGSGQLNIKMEN